MKQFSERAMSTSCALALAILLPAGGAAPGEDRKPDSLPKPNILLIVADDLGWADVGYHGSRIRTPVIDALVKGGVELDQHYVQPLCTPTRTALMTGRYPGRFGPHVLKPCNLRALPPGAVTLASALKALGYSTFLSGKWHLGSRPEWGPNQYGFDRSYGSLAGAVDPWTHKYRPGQFAATWQRDGQLLEEEGNATELVARQAVEWVRQKREPWFIYVPFQAVHIPVDTPEEYKQLYAGEKFFDDPVKDDSYRRFAAFVTQLDTKIGRLIEALDETGQRANTLVVFFSDNGGLPGGNNPYIGKVPDSPVLSSNLPLRGHKGQLYEGGIRVVALANWPGRLAPRKVTAPLHAVDWMPTLSRLAGYAPAADLMWDGRDMWPVISGAVESVESRTIYIPFTTGKAIRHGDWKLIVPRGGTAAKAASATEAGAATTAGAATNDGAATEDSAAGKGGKKAKAGKKDGPPKKAKAASKDKQAKQAQQGKKELYHLGRDPYEKEDLSDREPERVKELENLLEEMGKGDATAMPEDLKDFREDPALEDAPPAKAPPAEAPRADAPSGEK